MFIRRFLEQKCEGYSADFKRTYYSGRVEMDTGDIRTVYLIADEHGQGEWKQGICPRPAIVNEPT